MVSVLSHNIISPLGTTTESNLAAVRSGHSAIRLWRDRWAIPEAFEASLFTDEQTKALSVDGLSRFESLILQSARRAVADSGIDVSSSRTLFVLSTTKGNVNLLSSDGSNAPLSVPSGSAEVVARHLGISTMPVVVDNACVSGLSAIVLATRMIEMGYYDNAIVCGAECQSKFIVSGFQSLKSMSPQLCRPFDIERMGLNLGEASATLVLSRDEAKGAQWHVDSGFASNDAYNLTAPSRQADGAILAISKVMIGHSEEKLAFISAHGTATLFNDQMESVAIERTGLSSVPVCGLKGYYGHTMGACGVLETILSMAAVDNGVILPTKGFHELGVSGKIRVADREMTTTRQSFLKILSGFGGANVALLMSKMATSTPKILPDTDIKAVHSISITPTSVVLDGKSVATTAVGKALVTEVFKNYIGNYPRFYKMDLMCRLGVVATELLLKQEGGKAGEHHEDRAVVLVGRTGSVHADVAYLGTISTADAYYPSPERFIYTLPNIVAGEIAIRNQYHGETTYYSLSRRDSRMEERIYRSAFADPAIQSAICGWIDCETDNSFEAELYIMERK